LVLSQIAQLLSERIRIQYFLISNRKDQALVALPLH
jgi:hypothetical protein